MWRSVGYTIAQRLALLAATFVLVSLLVFVLLRVVGDVPLPFLGSDLTPAQRAAIEKELGADLGTDDPLHRQYVGFVADAVRGGPQESWFTRVSIRETLLDRLPASGELLVLSLAATTAVALAGASLESRFPGSPAGWLARNFVVAGASIPIFFSSILVILLPSEWWGYVPPRLGEEYTPFYETPWTSLRAVGPPALLIGIAASLEPMRLFQSKLAEPLRFGIGGVSSALASSLIVALPAAISSVIIVELMWSIRGVGIFYFQSVFALDIPPAQFLFLYAVLFAVGLRILLVQRRDEAIAVPASQSQSSELLWRRPTVIFAGALVAAFVILGIVGPYLTPQDPTAISVDDIKTGPSWDHPFGTDDIGRDMFSRVIVGARTSLKYAAVVAVLGYLPGWIAGRFVRRLGGRWRRVFEYAVAATAALPLLWVLLAMRIAFGPGRVYDQVLLALGVVAFFHGLGVALTTSRSLPPMAHASSGTNWRALARAWLATTIPLLAPELAVGACEVVVTTILMLSMLDFLGLGVVASTASWGVEVGRATASFPLAYHWLVFPGLALSITIFALNLLASSLRDALERPADGGAATEERDPLPASYST